MKIIYNPETHGLLLSIIKEAPKKSILKIAMAYADEAQGEKILNACSEKQFRLFFYGRIDKNFPISISFLKKIQGYEYLEKSKILYSGNESKEDPNLHAKVLWIENYGTYIGSSNLTERAWNSNIECGVWLGKEELGNDDVAKDLKYFFESIDNHRLSKDLDNRQIQELDKIYKEKRELEGDIREQMSSCEKNTKKKIKKILNIKKSDGYNHSNTINQSSSREETDRKNQVFYDKLLKEIYEDYPEIKLTEHTTNNVRSRGLNPYSHINTFRAGEKNRNRIGVSWSVNNEYDRKLFHFIRKKSNLPEGFKIEDQDYITSIKYFKDIHDVSSHEEQIFFLKKQTISFYKYITREINNLNE